MCVGLAAPSRTVSLYALIFRERECNFYRNSEVGLVELHVAIVS